MELFIQSVRKFNALEKLPRKTGMKHELYHSERHLIDRIGDHPGVNLSEFARSAGVTKGAVSQLVKKLEKKGIVVRYKSSGNDKEVFLELTRTGRDIYIKHKKTNEETIKPLVEELSKYPDEEVLFLVSMFKWICGYMDESREQMKRHA